MKEKRLGQKDELINLINKKNGRQRWPWAGVPGPAFQGNGPVEKVLEPLLWEEKVGVSAVLLETTSLSRCSVRGLRPL